MINWVIPLRNSAKRLEYFVEKFHARKLADSRPNASGEIIKNGGAEGERESGINAECILILPWGAVASAGLLQGSNLRG